VARDLLCFGPSRSPMIPRGSQAALPAVADLSPWDNRARLTRATLDQAYEWMKSGHTVLVSSRIERAGTQLVAEGIDKIETLESRLLT
jgi:hypothetical protein